MSTQENVDVGESDEPTLTRPRISVHYHRRPDSVWVSHFNWMLTMVFGCNHNIQYIMKSVVAYYIGMYESKSNKENRHSLQSAMNSVLKTLMREDLEVKAVTADPEKTPIRSDFANGLRRMNAAWRGHTSTETVGGPMSAIHLLGHNGWLKSFDTVPTSG